MTLHETQQLARTRRRNSRLEGISVIDRLSNLGIALSYKNRRNIIIQRNKLSVVIVARQFECCLAIAYLKVEEPS